ncbi:MULTISPECIES: hypothetical protein [unclassified Streptomyces]|uniref:Uncharacterized protein n=1 Tax=Streptomyces sp. NBC_00060 TaxID=2975636 RepID=A0AAU2HCW7_9ACTN
MTEPHVLFHYTSLASWKEIAAAGQIRPTSLAAEHIDCAMPLLWLTDSTNPADTALSDPGRTQIRITVAPEGGIRYWRMWRHLVPNAGALEPWGEPDSWYVSPGTVAAEYWGEVIDRSTNKVLRPASAAAPQADEWGVLPDAQAVDRLGLLLANGYQRRIEEIATVDETAAGDLTFRSIQVQLQVAEMKRILNEATPEQRVRAAWRTLRSEADAVQGVVPE